VFIRPQDYLAGEIKMNGKTVSTLRGNYMGFLDFDNERYWDVRDQFIFDVIPKDIS